MYEIKVPKEFLALNGQPFVHFKRDKKTNEFIAQKVLDGKTEIVLKDQNGNPVLETEDESFVEVLKAFIQGAFNQAEGDNQLTRARTQAGQPLPEPKLKMEDSSLAYQVFTALNIAKDTIELEKAPYEWLLGLFAPWGVRVLGINASVLHEVVKSATLIEPTRSEKRREEKSSKTIKK